MTEMPVTASMAMTAAETSFTVAACMLRSSTFLSVSPSHHEDCTQECQHRNCTDSREHEGVSVSAPVVRLTVTGSG